MTEDQEKFYNELCMLTGEQVVQAFTNWHGTQILTEEFMQNVYGEYFEE